MKNFIKSGCTVTLTAPYDVTSGDGFQVGAIFAVAAYTAASGADVEGCREGVVTLKKTSAQAWTQGQKIYWDNSNKRCDSDSTVGMLIGTAHVAAANPSSTGEVILNGAAPSTAEGPQAAITSLTDNTGGTANDTLTALGGLTTLTDNTGLSGSHDDTLAATSVPADITGGDSPTEAEHNAALAVMRVMAQNSSDIAQKVIEAVADIEDCRNNFADVAAKLNAILTALRNAGIIAT
ncbi:MAG TPA: capsid cement protein [Paucimonas sp.]|nr:capsid cement protein [Paucimonas sp.]